MNNRHTLGTLLSGILLAVPTFAHAQTLRITPSLIDSAHSVEQALIENPSHASTTIEGQGKVVLITYQSSEPLEVYMVPLEQNGNYTPTDYVRFTLPTTDEGTVAIDLTISPGWSTKNQKWLLTLLGKDKNTGAAFTDISFTNDGAGSTAIVALRHLFTEEVYTPSSYHALRGYRVLGTSFTIILGILTLVVALVCFIVAGKKNYRTTVILTLVIPSLLYQARFAVDLLRFSLQHTQEYARGIYDEAGSIHAVADVLRTLAKPGDKTTVYVCRDGTNFKEKLLRYFTYPARVSSDANIAPTADYAVVMDKFKWGFETSVTKEASTVRLKCGDIDREAKKLSTFPDGEILFQLLPSQARS